MNRQVTTTQSISLLVAISFLIVGSLSACALPPTPTINKKKAIEIAIDACKIPHLVLVSEPKNIRTKLLTLGEADQLTMTEGVTTRYDIPMDTRVWLVQMDGQLQIEGGPAPAPTETGQVATPTPPQPFWGTCTAVLDAKSGTLIFTRGEHTSLPKQ